MSELRDLFVPGSRQIPERAVHSSPEEAPAPAMSPARLLRVMAAIIAAATLAAYMASNAKERVWGGRVELVFSGGAYDSEAEFERALATQGEILRSEPVLGPPAAAAGMSTAALEKRLRVDTGRSEVVKVTVGHPSRSRARSLAQAVAESYLERVTQSPKEDSGAVNLLRSQIEELTKTLDATTARQRELEVARSGAGGPTADELRLREETADLVRRIGGVREEMLALEVRRTTSDDARILAPARVLKDPIEPRPKQAAVGGFLIGSALAAGVAYVLRFLPPRRVEKVDRPDVF